MSEPTRVAIGTVYAERTTSGEILVALRFEVPTGVHVVLAFADWRLAEIFADCPETNNVLGMARDRLADAERRAPAEAERLRDERAGVTPAERERLLRRETNREISSRVAYDDYARQWWERERPPPENLPPLPWRMRWAEIRNLLRRAWRVARGKRA